MGLFSGNFVAVDGEGDVGGEVGPAPSSAPNGGVGIETSPLERIRRFVFSRGLLRRFGLVRIAVHLHFSRRSAPRLPRKRRAQHAKRPQNVVAMRPRLPQPVVMKIQRVLRLVLGHPPGFRESKRVGRGLHRGPQSRRGMVARRRMAVMPVLSLHLVLQGRVALGQGRRREGVDVAQGLGVPHEAFGEFVAALGEGQIGHSFLAGFEDVVLRGGRGVGAGVVVRGSGARRVRAVRFRPQSRRGQFLFHGSGRVSVGRVGGIGWSAVGIVAGGTAAGGMAGAGADDGDDFDLAVDEVV
mmetsp:Transcript_7459/g.16027  ORF Transcript_7459/g.16027 Transcript_7459/m.16027 type:complete len:297 (+) Transcript_7459:2453-3343(+)